MEKHLSLRINAKLLKKFRYVCAYEGRSANKQLIQLILKFVREYEDSHEKIPDEDLK